MGEFDCNLDGHFFFEISRKIRIYEVSALRIQVRRAIDLIPNWAIELPIIEGGGDGAISAKVRNKY